ncbi:MAG: hypothetical protein AABX99_01370 [Nanoarchaeota archaeon]
MDKEGAKKEFCAGNKHGQFFLIAAVVIIVVIVSVVTISNYTQKKDTAKLYDLGKELGIESQNVLDYGTYNAKNPDEIKTMMEQFIVSYHNYQEQDKNIYFLFGNKDAVNVLGYQDIAEEDVCIKLSETQKIAQGTECKNYNLIGTTQTYSLGVKINQVAIVVSETQYEFGLKTGENFYFIIWQKIGGERHFVTSET